MSKKFKLHTSIEERKKQHRDAYRKISWGKGVKSEVKFSLKLLRPNFLISWCAIILLFCLVNFLPYQVLMLLGKIIGRLIYKFLPSRRYIVNTNLQLAFPQKSEQERHKLALEVFENAGRGVFETGMAWFWPDFRVKRIAHVDEKSIQKAKDLLNSGHNILGLTCHMVTMELCARIYSLYIGSGVGVYRSSDHPVWEYIQVKGRLRSSYAMIDRKDVRSIIRTILKGVPVWYAPDQDFGAKASIFVPFFSVKNTATITGTHDLAKMTNSLVHPFCIIRKPNGYHLQILDTIENFPSEDKIADTIKVNQVIEQMINQAPNQYLWMHRRFKTAPPNEASRYPQID